MNEQPKKKKHSLWWIWIILILAAYAGGIVTGLELNTLPLPSEVQGKLYPILESYIPGSTKTREPKTETPAPEVTELPAETEAPAETETPAPHARSETTARKKPESTSPGTVRRFGTRSRRSQGMSHPGGAETACAAGGIRQFAGRFHVRARHGGDHELRNAHAAFDRERRIAEIGQYHAYLAAVAFIDRSRGIEDCDAVLQRQTGARAHLAFGPRRQLHGQSGAEQPAAARLQNAILGRMQVHAGVARMGVRRNDRAGVELLEYDLCHRRAVTCRLREDSARGRRRP